MVMEIAELVIATLQHFKSIELYNFITLFDLPQNTNNDKTRQLHKSK